MKQTQKDILSRWQMITEMWPEEADDAQLADIVLQLKGDELTMEEALQIVSDLREGIDQGRNAYDQLAGDSQQPLGRRIFEEFEAQGLDEDARSEKLRAACETLLAEMKMEKTEEDWAEFDGLDCRAQCDALAELLNIRSRQKLSSMLDFAWEAGADAGVKNALSKDDQALALSLAIWLESGGKTAAQNAGIQTGAMQQMVQNTVGDGANEPRHIALRLCSGVAMLTAGVLGFVKVETIGDGIAAIVALIEGEMLANACGILLMYVSVAGLALLALAGAKLLVDAGMDWHNERKRRKAMKERAMVEKHFAGDAAPEPSVDV